MKPEPADSPASSSRADAQARADRIAAFTRELDDLDRAGVLRLDPADRARVGAYHGDLLDQFARRFDVDRSDRQRRMSLGMRIASLVGAITLSAAVVFFFYRIWGLISTPLQLGVLTAAPLVLLGLVEFAARREKTLYIASVLAVTALAAFVLDLQVSGAILNMGPSPYAFSAWAAFALLLAYRYGLRLLLGAGLALAMAFACALVASRAGLDLQAFPARPEPLLPLGALAVALAPAAPNRGRPGFPETWRLTGTIALLVPLIFLSTWSGVFSYLRWPDRVLGPIYDAAGFGLGAGAVWLAIRRGWREVVRAGATFLVLFLFAKCFDWWWDWMPRYLFFLVLGGLAVAVLIVLGRVRAGAPPGGR